MLWPAERVKRVLLHSLRPVEDSGNQCTVLPCFRKACIELQLVIKLKRIHRIQCSSTFESREAKNEERKRRFESFVGLLCDMHDFPAVPGTIRRDGVVAHCSDTVRRSSSGCKIKEPVCTRKDEIVLKYQNRHFAFEVPDLSFSNLPG